MKEIARLLDLDCGAMLSEIARGLGRKLTLAEQLELALLSGAYKGNGGGVYYCDLEHPPAKVSFPQYLKVLGYPAAGPESLSGRRAGEL